MTAAAGTERQRGAFLILAAVFLLIVLAFLGVVFLSTFTTSTSTALNSIQSTRAFYLAGAGLQFTLKTGAFCSYDVAATPLGSGSFSVTTLSVGPGGLMPTTVSSAVASGDTAIDVLSTTDYSIPGTITIDSENIFCAGKTGIQFTGCLRPWAGSTPAAHAAGAAVTQCVIRSTGVVGKARRIVQATVGS